MGSCRLSPVLRTFVVLALFMGVAACSGDDSYFQALLADPMAEYQPPGTELERRGEVPATGFLERGRSAPVILLEYAILEGADPETVLDETVAYAMSVGWEFERAEPRVGFAGNLVQTGSKDVGLPTRAELGLGTKSQGTEFSVRLTYPQAVPP